MHTALKICRLTLHRQQLENDKQNVNFCGRPCLEQACTTQKARMATLTSINLPLGSQNLIHFVVVCKTSATTINYIPTSGRCNIFYNCKCSHRPHVVQAWPRTLDSHIFI